MHTPRLALPTPWPRQAEPTGTCSHAAFSGRHEQRGGSSCPSHSLMRYPSTGLPLTLKLSFSAANGGTRVTISGKSVATPRRLPINTSGRRRSARTDSSVQPSPSIGPRQNSYVSLRRIRESSRRHLRLTKRLLTSADFATNIVPVQGSLGNGYAAVFNIAADIVEVDATGSLSRPNSGAVGGPGGSPPTA